MVYPVTATSPFTVSTPPYISSRSSVMSSLPLVIESWSFSPLKLYQRALSVSGAVRRAARKYEQCQRQHKRAKSFHIEHSSPPSASGGCHASPAPISHRYVYHFIIRTRICIYSPAAPATLLQPAVPARYGCRIPRNAQSASPVPERLGTSRSGHYHCPHLLGAAYRPRRPAHTPHGFGLFRAGHVADQCGIGLRTPRGLACFAPDT